MGLGNRPNRLRSGLVKRVLGKIEDGDKSRVLAMAIYKDLHWAIRTTCTNYEEIGILIDQAKLKAEGIPDEQTRKDVIEKLDQMRARCSEFTVEEEPGLLFCCQCGREIAPGDYVQEVESQVANLYRCAICSASPGNEGT